MIIKRGILETFNASNYTASVLLFEATSYALSGVPVANHIDGTSAISGALCAVLFFDEHNAQDAVVIAVFANGANGFPTPPAARLTFVTGYQQLSNVVIASSTTSTYSLSGGGSGIPSSALGVLYKAFFTSPSVGASIHLAPHAASDITAYATIGNLAVANGSVSGTGLLQIDSVGKIDIKANGGACTVTFYTYGYVN